MAQSEVLGHIDCPTCGTAKGMRITHDKNGEPFGFCEAQCGQQLRIGGDKRRVRDFVVRYPFAGTVTGHLEPKKPEPEPAKNPVTVTDPEPPKKPVRAPVANPFDFLLNPKATT